MVVNFNLRSCSKNKNIYFDKIPEYMPYYSVYFSLNPDLPLNS